MHPRKVSNRQSPTMGFSVLFGSDSVAKMSGVSLLFGTGSVARVMEISFIFGSCSVVWLE